MDASPFSALTTYERLHLVAHLAEARQRGALHKLLSLEVAESRNGWYELKQERNEAASYLADLSIAWADAEVADDLPLASRYTMVSSSWISLASSLHPHMLPALVRAKLWSSERALAAARDTTLFRSEALALLTPLLDARTNEAVFAVVVEELKREGSSLRMRLDSFGHLLPETAVREILSWPPRMLMYGVPVHQSDAVLLPRLAELGASAEALQRAEELPPAPERYVAFCGIAPFLDKGLGLALLERLAGEFKASDHIEPDATMASALAHGFAALGDPTRAREAAERDAWPGTRDFTLEPVVLAFARSGDLQEANRVAKAIESPHKRARTLARLSVHLAGAARAALLTDALALARETWQGHVAALRIKALAEVGSRLDEPLRSQVLEEALDAALQGDSFGRGSSVADIAELLTPELLARALAALQVIGGDREAVEAGAACRDAAAGGATDEIHAQCIRMLEGLPRGVDRWIAARTLLSDDDRHVANVLSLASAAASSMEESNWERDDALTLPSIAQEQWARLLLDIAERRPPLRPRLVPALAGVVRGVDWQEAFDFACELTDKEHRFDAYESLIAGAPSDHLDRLLALAAKSRDQRALGRVRGAVARRLATMADRFDDALAIAKKIQDKAGRLNALGDVAHFAPDSHAVLPDILAALNAVGFRDIDLRIGGVAEALPHELRQPFLRAVLDWTARLSESERDRAFHDLAGPLAQAGLTEEALTCARAGQPQDQIAAMARVAKQAADSVRGEIVREAFGLAMMLPAGLSQATALCTLLPVLDGELRERTVTMLDVDALAAEIPASLARIVPLLLPQRTDDVLRIALAREEVLTAFAAVTIDAPTDDLRRYWRAVTRAAGRLERAKALRMIGTIAAWTRRIGGEAALIGVVRSIVQVRRSWP